MGEAPKYPTKRNLACKLTTDELLVVMKELAKGTQDLKAKENQLSTVKKTFAAELTQIEATIEINSIKASTGEEYRSVQCEVIIHVKDRVKKIVRLDTGEEIEEAKLDQDDLQYQLGIAKKNKDQLT